MWRGGSGGTWIWWSVKLSHAVWLELRWSSRYARGSKLPGSSAQRRSAALIPDNLSLRYSQTTGDITTTTDHTSLSHPYPPSFPSQPPVAELNPDMYLDIPSPNEGDEGDEVGNANDPKHAGVKDVIETTDTTDESGSFPKRSNSQAHPSCGQPMREVVIEQEVTMEYTETQSFPASLEIESQRLVGGSPFVPITQAFGHSQDSPSNPSQPSQPSHPSDRSLPSDLSLPAEQSVHSEQSGRSAEAVHSNAEKTARPTPSVDTPARPRPRTSSVASPALGFGVALQTPIKDFKGGRPGSGEKGQEGVGFGWGLGK